MKPYAISSHAIDMAVERLERKRAHAKNELIQLMQTARYQGESGEGRVFDHYASRTRLILADDTDKVITVYPMDSEKPAKYYDKPKVAIEVKPNVYNAIIEKARQVITKEIAKARKQFTTESRKLVLTEAEIGVEIAQLALNKARARNPLTQASIATRINELEAGRQAVFAELIKVRDKFESMRKDAESYL